jgi:uncharacterized membrane protein YcfT
VWPDVAKGICISLVVLWHCTSKSLDEFVVQGSGASQFWSDLSTVLTAVRMPLFFTISGIFAASALAKPLRNVLRRRVANLYYLYAIWLVFQTLAFAAFPLDTIKADSPVKFIALMILGVSTLWYLYALVIYFLIAYLFQRVAIWGLTVAACMSAAVATFDVPSVGNSTSMVQNLVFFLAGAYYPATFKRVASAVTPGRSAVVFGIFATSSFVALRFSAQRIPFAILALSILGVLVGMCAAVLLTKWKFHLYLSWLGTVTLAVYVLHPILLAVLNAALRAAEVSVVGGWAYAYPAIVGCFVIAACLVVRWLIKRVGLGCLFELPRFSRPAFSKSGSVGS